MTMIAACRFADGAVVIADARATWLEGNRQSFQDTLQKLISLGPKTALCFAGDVTAAAIIISQLRWRINKNSRLSILQKLAAEIPRIARHYYQLYKSKNGKADYLALY